MRTVKQNFLYKTTNIHRDRKGKFSHAHRCVKRCWPPSTHLVCTPHTATILSQRNWMKSVSFQTKNYGCAEQNPSDKNQLLRGKWLLYLLHRHLGIGGCRNRFWYRGELNKKSTWFERTSPIIKNIWMPMREHSVCKSEWTSFFSKVRSGNCQSRQIFQFIWKESLVLPAQNIYLLTHRTVKKHFFQIQKTSLHNARCLHTVHKVRVQQVGMEELQLVWY